MLGRESSRYLVKRQYKEILEKARRVAIVGLRGEPIFKSYGRTEKLIEYGLTVFPVMTERESIFGVSCYNRLQDINAEVDIVQVYPDRGLDLFNVARETVRKGTKVFWLEDAEAPEAVRKLLTEAKVYVVEDENLEREYRKHCLPRGAESLDAKDKPSSKVSERMTRNPVTAKAQESISDAIGKMRKGHFRHLPVVDDNDRLVGMLSDRDLRLIHPSSAFVSYEQMMEQLATIKVEQAAVFSPVAVLHDATVEEAAHLMLRWEVGALPVVSNDSHLVGILSSSDLLKELLARSHTASVPV
jgi:CBS domain-containing protein